jgi:glycosyltransferase involved in cell wall biosynthesis
MSDPRPVLLALIPQPPPFGGVAFQASLLLQSRAFTEAFEVVRLRTNSVRLAENPDRKHLDLRSVAGALRLAASTLAAAAGTGYSAVYCVANGDLSFPWVVDCALSSARLRRCPLVLHVHASRSGFWEWQKQQQSDRAQASALRRMISRMGDRICAGLSSGAAGLIHLSSAIDQRYRSLGWRPADLVLPNSTSVPPSFDPLRKQPGRMLFLGRISREKGFFDLLEALAGLGPEAGRWELHVAGAVPAGEEHSEVESAARSPVFGGRIILHGLVRGSEKASLLETCSILVHPTHRDVFPMAVVEAMAAGMAVVSTGVGEIPSIPAADGWAQVGAGDPGSLRACLANLIADPSLVASMGASNRAKALAEYEVEANAGRVTRLILDSIRKGAR